eukprot:4778870-Pyramimonas_sp.AAC.1
MYAKLQAAKAASARVDEERHAAEDARIPSSTPAALEPATQRQSATVRLYSLASQQAQASPAAKPTLSSATSGPRK